MQIINWIFASLFLSLVLGSGMNHSEKLEFHKDLKDFKGFDKPVYAHLIAHTHDDVGWLKTVDEYYTGSNDKNAHACVRLILETTIDELIKDPTKKFTYVEMKVFSMWWDE